MSDFSNSNGVVLGFLLDSTKDYIQYNVNLIGGLNENIQQLMRDMDVMKAFVKDCTEKHNDDEKMMETLAKNVQKVALQAEDTIDKYILCESRHKRKNKVERMVDFGYWKELRAVGKECEKVSDQMKNLYQNKMPVAITARRNSAEGSGFKKKRIHTAPEDNIIGFEDVAIDVKNLLTGGNENLEVYSIVGMVGLGKTTLARKVFQDRDIEYEFFARAFVSVSQVYEKKEVLLKILSNFMEVTDEISKMLIDTIKDKIHKELNGKQYLIVLDDVWENDAWDDLQDAFPKNKKHSRILITTREKPVARHANPSAEPYELRFMKDDEPKRLLRWKVFGKDGCPDDLEPQIKKNETRILEKCKGLPLSIVVVAGLLLDRKTRPNWWKRVYERMLNSDLEAEKMSSELIRLSFDHLPPYMQSCFLYLGVFPEDLDIPVWKLIRLWIAEGFIQGSGNLDDVAERYLEAMVDRNLVMVAESKWDGQIKKCRVHDFLRDFCKNEAMRMDLFQEVKGGTPVNPKQLSVDDYRRISINSQVLEYVASKPSGKRVCSFLSFSKEETRLSAKQVNIIPEAFGVLRVFDARAIKFISFPPKLFKLVLLKYIAMSCNVGTISEKLGRLVNLQTFIFETNSPTLNIKADIWKMEQFKNLHVNTSATLPPVPIQGSTQTTSNVETLTDIAPESCTREVFQRCTKLKKLGIRGGNLAKNGLFDNLLALESLENLKLLNGNVDVPLPFLPDRWKFPSTLNRLTLCRTSLSWDHIDTLGELDNLEVLKLKDNAFVGDFWTVKDGGFSKLAVLHIVKTDLLKWEASSAHFPLLTTLILKHCNKLTGIPLDFAQIATFKRIDLHWTPKAYPSAKEIKRLKVQTQTEKNSPGFKLGVYPPESA